MFEKLGKTISAKVEEIGETLKEAIKAQSQPFDVSEFNSEIAKNTEWIPLKPGGTNMQTHKISEKNGETSFKPSFGILLFSGIFMIAGLAFSAYGIFMTYSRGELFNFSEMAPNLIPLIFFIAGFLLMRGYTKPIVFSKNTGYFWKGRLGKNEQPDLKPLKEYCRLIDIAAIQIIGETVRSSSSSSSGSRSSNYRSYEINLVLKDSRRVNVIDHGRKNIILEDAKKLSDFLQVPVWDKSGRF